MIEHNGRQLHLPEWASIDRWQSFQRPIFEEICDRFDDGNRLVVADVPTGGGKSLLAYMVHQYIGGKAAILTSQKELQRQYADDFDVAVMMGRSNYLPQEIPEPDITCADCDLDRKTGLCSFCPSPMRCSYTVAKEIAAEHELADLNYAYFLGECNGRSSKFTGRDLVIADECDVLEQEIMGHVSIRITPLMQRRLTLRPPDKKTVASSWEAWFDYAIPIIERQLKHWPRDTVANRRQFTAIKRLFENMADIAEHVDEYVYDGYDNGSIEFKPVTVDRIAPKVLWPHGEKWLAMSATVVSPEEFVASLGFTDSWAAVFAPSTFPKERRPIYLTPVATMTKKTEVTAWPESIPGIEAILERHPNERVLIHSHSREYTKYLANMLEDNERPIFHYLNAAERKQAIEDYESTPAAVLLAMSLGRGYDGKDDLCRVIILAKTPYPSLGDKQVSMRLRRDGGQYWYDVNVARTVVQMVGRGMRHEEDSVTVYITDAVFSSFMAKWSSGQGRHRLFPSWFMEAYHLNSPVRHQVRVAVAQKKREKTLKATV